MEGFQDSCGGGRVVREQKGKVFVATKVPPKNGLVSGVRKTLIGQPPDPVIA